MRSNENWRLVYSSLAGLRNDMSEPQISTIMPGESISVRWMPQDDQAFNIRNQRGAQQYRLILRSLGDLRDEQTTDLESPTFRVE